MSNEGKEKAVGISVDVGLANFLGSLNFSNFRLRGKNIVLLFVCKKNIYRHFFGTYDRLSESLKMGSENRAEGLLKKQS